MKPVFDRTPRCMPPGVASGTRRKFPSRESARASRSWEPSNCGGLVSITGRTPYSTEFNPTERLWQHTRKTGTHNRYFATASELVGTLSRVFGEMQDHPESIRSYLLPSC